MIFRNIFRFSTKTLVLVRHGESIWNRQKKWAGWQDVRLSTEGIQQALECAEIIKKNNFTFDEAYTSVLRRAIKTLNYVLDELDLHYIPVKKVWRLNEKFYGSLQGENKIDITERFGEELVTQWRRSFDIRPPALDRHDQRHPSFDHRYSHLDPDELPVAQALGDIVKRVQPLWREELKPKIENGKRLLIVAHGSSLRALVKLIDNKSDEEIKNFNIPNATPLVYTLNEQLKPIHLEYLGDESQIEIQMQKIRNETYKAEV